jgi:hypothetical protein
MLHSISDIGVGGLPGASRTVQSFVKKYPEPFYQDLVVGRAIHRVGTDVCDSRYALIKPVLDLQPEAFSVLDVGAAQGYFSFRIARDYPRSSCVMLEADGTSYYARHGSMLTDLCEMNDLPNVACRNGRIGLPDLTAMAATEHFDVALALLVVHLIDGRLREQIRIVDALLTVSDHLILEVASDVAVLHTAYVEYLAESRHARYLGEVTRHKDPASTETGKLFWFAGRSPRAS